MQTTSSLVQSGLINPIQEFLFVADMGIFARMASSQCTALRPALHIKWGLKNGPHCRTTNSSAKAAAELMRLPSPALAFSTILSRSRNSLMVSTGMSKPILSKFHSPGYLLILPPHQQWSDSMRRHGHLEFRSG